MALPTPQYWTRLPDITPTANTAVAFLAALDTALHDLAHAVDYFGNAIPVEHQWGEALRVDAVELSPPAGSVFVGRVAICASAAMGGKNWTSSFTNNVIYAAFTTDPGATWSSYNHASGPWGVSAWTPGWQCAGAGVTGVLGRIMIFLSDEKIAMQIRIGNDYYPFALPGIIQPILDEPSFCESDSRLYAIASIANSVLVYDWMHSSVSFLNHEGGNNLSYKFQMKLPRVYDTIGVSRLTFQAATWSGLDGRLPSGTDGFQRIALQQVNPYKAVYCIGELRDIYWGPPAIAGIHRIDNTGRTWFSFAAYNDTSFGHSLWLPGVL